MSFKEMTKEAMKVRTKMNKKSAKKN